MTNLSAALSAARRNRPPKRRKSPEAQFQRSLVDLLEMALPTDATITAIDHSDPSPAQRARRASLRVKDGIPDVLIIWPPTKGGPLQIVVWIECKDRKGPQRDAQEIWQKHVTAAGQTYILARTLEQATEGVRKAGIPLRGILM